MRNKEFDFIAKNGKSATFVIFIGGNGCGKTTLIDFIYQIIVKTCSIRCNSNHRTFANNLNIDDNDYFEFFFGNKIYKIELSSRHIEKQENSMKLMRMKLSDIEYQDYFNFLCAPNDLSYKIIECSFYNSPVAKIDYANDMSTDFGEYTIPRRFIIDHNSYSFNISNDNTKSTICKLFCNSKINKNSLYSAANMRDQETKKILNFFEKNNVFSGLNEKLNFIKLVVTNDGKNVFINEKNGECYSYNCLSSGFKKKIDITTFFYNLKMR